MPSMSLPTRVRLARTRNGKASWNRHLREDVNIKRSIPLYSTLLEHEIMTWMLFLLMLFARKGHDIHDTDHRQ